MKRIVKNSSHAAVSLQYSGTIGLLNVHCTMYIQIHTYLNRAEKAGIYKLYFYVIPVAEFIDPDWGDGKPVRQPYAGVDFIPQAWIYEFGY